MTAKGEDNEEESGGQDGPGSRHLPSAWVRPLPGANTSVLWGQCSGVGWGGSPQRVSVPGSVRGRAGAVGGPSSLLAARTACMSRQRATRAQTARAGRAALAGVGSGGVWGSGLSVGGQRGLEPHTGGPHHPPCLRQRARGPRVPAQAPRLPAHGSWSPPGGRWPPPLGSCARAVGGRREAGGWAKATRGHDAWCTGREG